MPFDEHDLQTESFSNAKGWSAVRVTHVPSALVAERHRSDALRSAVQAQRECIDELERRLTAATTVPEEQSDSTPISRGEFASLGRRVAADIDGLLAANEAFAVARANVADSRPSRRLAVLTCMDVRIDVFAVLGLRLGEAHILRNAGGRVTDDVLRSLALSTHVLGVETLVVMQHTKCGLAGVTDDELRARTGATMDFFPIDDHAAALEEDIETVSATSFLTPLRRIAGFVYDVESGRLDDVVRWERQ